MKIRPANLFWLVVLILVIGGFIYVAIPARPDNRAKAAVAATRQLLRQQGFKTDLADFDFSTSPKLRAREAILKSTVPTNRFAEPFREHPNLMEIIGTNSVVVVWKENALKRPNPSWPDNNDEMTWSEFREAVNTNQPEIDAACAAILAGPIAFNLDARGGNYILLPHLALLKNLTQIFGDRIVLALHDGDKNSAFTNLLAATRLVTAWNPEPAEISHLVRFGDAKIVFDETWQAFQTNDWPDDKLAQLQTEWESANFFANLPGTAAFRRASYVAACEQERREISDSRPPFSEFFYEALHYPLVVWSDLRYRWSRENYPRRGAYNDETNLLIFYRDREVELRNAAQAQTWAQMRGMPGVTNRIFFQTKNHSRIQSMMNLHELSLGFQRQGGSLLSRAAETEARRRILIVAIALERYRDKHGSYPKTLAELAPEFLKTIPPDFMDGEPLRYRLMDDGHFILYSVGQDCVDNGGKLPAYEWETKLSGGATRFASPPDADLVWPLPASAAEVASLRQKERREMELRDLSQQQRESEEEWEQSPLRQSRVENILATDWLSDTNSDEIRRVISIFSNKQISTNHQPSLAELFTPHQIITGDEPEDLTFEFPVSYEVVTDFGFFLLLDADTNADDMFAPDSGAKMQEQIRGTNGDCLLVWHTIFDPPGKHALQVEWTMSDTNGERWGKGPAITIVTSNLCQFSLASAHFDYELGADFQARLPESNGAYTAEMKTTNGILLKTISGSTTNGVIKLHWDLIDDHGQRFTNEFFNSVFHITLPDSGRSQTLRGP
ncbi:MAG TPA: hypothetical protein VHG71_13435 [Verrucomicrobiae bacterium]|nr:hypothetical protein [Verrucomicrobiae bacterium]